jgi:hypothetical protein
MLALQARYFIGRFADFFDSMNKKGPAVSRRTAKREVILQASARPAWTMPTFKRPSRSPVSATGLAAQATVMATSAETRMLIGG